MSAFTATVVGSIVYAPVSGFPAGSVVDHINVTVTGSAPGNTTPVVQNVAPGTASVTFSALPADSYTFSVEGQAADNTPFGSPVTGSFTVASTTTVSLSLPTSATFAQQ